MNIRYPIYEGVYRILTLREHFEKHSDEVKAYCQKSYNKIF